MPKKIQFLPLLLTGGLVAAICACAAFAFSVRDLSDRVSGAEREAAVLRKENERLKIDLVALRAAQAVIPKAVTPSAGMPTHSPASALPENPPVNDSAASAATAESADTEYRVSARLSALEKFVPISPEQREQLAARYREQMAAGTGAPNSDSIIEEVIGRENAAYYREQRARAFQRAEEEEREKEALLLSRRLSLSSEQEARLQEVIREVDRELSAAGQSVDKADAALSMAERVRLMIEENRKRQELLDSRLKEIFSAEQYQRYIEQEMDSTERNMEVFHGPP